MDGTDRNGAPVTRSVTNVEGSYKVDELMARQLKFFFDVDIPQGDYLNIRVALWGKPGENLAKFNVNEGDLYMFMLRSIELGDFARKNGSTGYQLNAQAFDFDPLHTKKAEGNNSGNSNSSNTGKARPKSAARKAAPPVPEHDDYGADDFAAIDDSDDLPF